MVAVVKAETAQKGGHTLGWTFVIGLAISLWSANAAMKNPC
jgi:membrane protein